MLRRSIWMSFAFSAYCGAVPSAWSEDVNVVKIGIAEQLTELSASHGKDEENAAWQAFKEANRQGLVIGGRKVQSTKAGTSWRRAIG